MTRLRDTEWADVGKVVLFIVAIAGLLWLGLWGEKWKRERIADTVVEKLRQQQGGR